MTKPVTIPNTFATATTAIPLSNLDADFSTVATALNDANTYSNYAPDTGSANAYVVTLSGVSTTYSAGLRIQFKAGNANTTASTLNVNGGGAKNITYQDATAIASGTIAANSIVDVMYDGTQFLLMNDPAGATGGDVVGPSSATDNAIVRFDGTTGKLVQNSVVTIADSTGDVSGVGQLNATTVDATNIEVTNIKAKDGTAAASIADSTGVISITSNPVLSGGTANGVLYLNGSKVATSGSALTFDGSNLTVKGGNGGQLVLDNGGQQFVQQVFQINGAANSGGDFSFDGTNSVFNMRTLAVAPIAFSVSASAGNPTEQMRLTSTGLGIGTSSPSARLTAKAIGNGYANSAALSLVSTASQTTYITNVGGAMYVSNDGTNDQVVLSSSGNLGLGVTPSAWSVRTLQLAGNPSLSSVNGADIAYNAFYDGAWKYVGSARALLYSQVASSGSHAWLTAPSGTAGNAITFSQAMTLDASGNLGVGTTSPIAIGAGYTSVTVNGSNSGRFDVLFNGTHYGAFQADSGGAKVLAQGASTPLVLGTNNTERARITSGGDFQTSSGNSVMIGGTAARATTAGTNRLDIFDGTAPVGTLANGVSFYSTAGEARVMDAAGNATLLSPHDTKTNEWIFHSKHTPTGKVLRIDVERLLKFVNDHFGLDAVQEFIEP